jgi:hypothetical protein
MFRKKLIVSSLFLVLFLGFFVTKIVAKDDDEDNIIGEIVTDLFIGVAVSICEKFVICKFFMFLISFMFVMIIIVGVCVGEINVTDICNGRNTRRALTVGAGYGLVRSFRRR